MVSGRGDGLARVEEEREKNRRESVKTGEMGQREWRKRGKKKWKGEDELLRKRWVGQRKRGKKEKVRGNELERKMKRG